MKKYFFIFVILMFFQNSEAFSENGCFIAKDLNSGKILLTHGNKCDARHSPASSFKIALALIGFNEKILIDEANPKVKYEEIFRQDLNFDPMKMWLGERTPTSWIKNSIVWYSQQVITRKIGIEKFQKYINSFNYGNKDLSGDYKKNNGLTHAWLSSSLQISPKEQIGFLEKFLLSENDIISDEAREYAKKILYRKQIGINSDWKLFGKTGSGELLNENYQRDVSRPLGWFVGFIEKNNKKILFVNYIEKENKSSENIFIGGDAEKIAIMKLETIIKNYK